MVDILNATVFQQIAAYIEQEANKKYMNIVNKFLQEVWQVLQPDEQKKLEVHINHHNIDGFTLLKVKLDLFHNSISNTRVEQNTLLRCQARTSAGTQCTRPLREESLKLCRSHCKSNPYGFITDPKQQKLKGNNIKVLQTTKGIDLSAYIRTTEIEIENNNYLMDENGILYDPTNFKIIAQITDNKIYWYKMGNETN